MILYSQILSLEAPAKRSEQSVGNWFKGLVFNPKKKEVQPSARGPQFLSDSGISKIFGPRETIGKDSEKVSNDLVSLHPPADDDLITKKIAKSRWTSRLFKVSSAASDADLAKNKPPGQCHV